MFKKDLFYSEVILLSNGFVSYYDYDSQFTIFFTNGAELSPL